jgi:hypothetical protein
MKTLRCAFLMLVLCHCCRAAADDRRCIFSLEVLSDPTSGARRPGETWIGEGIFLYESTDGYIVGELRRNNHGDQPASSRRFGGGPEFRDRIHALFRAAALHNPDFARELRDGKQRAEMAGVLPWGYVGFGTSKLTAHFEGTDVDIRTECLRGCLEHFSSYVPDFQRLNYLIEQIEVEYVRTELGMIY